MIVGFTGTRVGMQLWQKKKFIDTMFLLKVTEFHHGDCIGADADAHHILERYFPEIRIVIHPPCVNTARAYCTGHLQMEPLPYIERNHAIVNSSEHLIGAPATPEIKRSGTWATIRYARAKGIPTTIFEPRD